MKYFVGFLLMVSLCYEATAAHFSLVKADLSAYEKSIEKIKLAIAAEDTKREIPTFDYSQSFLLKDQTQEPVGYLVPVKFNSRSYKNTICRLYFVDLNNKLAFAEIFAEKNDDDDVVSSCVGIEATSMQTKTADVIGSEKM